MRVFMYFSLIFVDGESMMWREDCVAFIEPSNAQAKMFALMAGLCHFVEMGRDSRSVVKQSGLVAGQHTHKRCPAARIHVFKCSSKRQLAVTHIQLLNLFPSNGDRAEISEAQKSLL